MAEVHDVGHVLLLTVILVRKYYQNDTQKVSSIVNEIEAPEHLLVNTNILRNKMRHPISILKKLMNNFTKISSR